MIISYSFSCKEPKEEKSLIVLTLRCNGEKKRFSIGMIRPTASWDQNLQQFKKNFPGAMADNEMINRWKLAADAAIRNADVEGWSILDVKDRIMATMFKDQKGQFGERSLFLTFFEKFCHNDSTKRLSTRQMTYSYNLFKEFIGTRRITFKDMTYRLMEEYIEWMAKKGLSSNTRGCQIKRIKTAMHESFDKGLHNNEEFKKFRKETEDSDSIYLTTEEIKKIENVELTGPQDKARDLFIIGCHTALRYSDFSELKSKDIVDGMIRKVQKKTGDYVIIPCHPKVMEILKKWDGVPTLSNVQLNKLIKEVCEKAGIDAVIPIRMRGERRVTYHKKWELVSSHTARRSAATNMFLEGIPPIAIMKITGHRTETTFMKYIKVSKEENARLLLTSPFFR